MMMMEAELKDLSLLAELVPPLATWFSTSDADLFASWGSVPQVRWMLEHYERGNALMQRLKKMPALLEMRRWRCSWVGPAGRERQSYEAYLQAIEGNQVVSDFVQAHEYLRGLPHPHTGGGGGAGEGPQPRHEPRVRFSFVSEQLLPYIHVNTFSDNDILQGT